MPFFFESGSLLHSAVQFTDHERLRDEHHAALKQIINNQNETAMKLAVCLDRNTEALQECSFELRRFKERNSA